MIVTACGSSLTLGFGVLSLELTPLEADTFLVPFPDGGSEVFRFEDGLPDTLDWGGRLFDRRC